MASKGLCFRCEHRAVFLETGIGSRCECGNIDKATGGCYMYEPVRPLCLKKNAGDSRPQFAGAMFSSRSYSESFADCRLNLEESKEGSTLYWTPKSLDTLHEKARETIWFLDSHPALGCQVFGIFSLLDVQIEKVDKRGRLEPFKGVEDVFWNKKNYKKFKKEFDEEFKNCSPEELEYKPLITIQVPYEKIYGEKWSFDHIEYWGELSFTAFPGKKFIGDADIKKWVHLAGVETGGRSFQELIINIGIEFKKKFGNFSGEDFLTAAEKKNNKEEEIFLFKKATANANIITRNPKYNHIGPGELNRRWWKWFAKTPLCKKQWGDTAKIILSGKEFI